MDGARHDGSSDACSTGGVLSGSGVAGGGGEPSLRSLTPGSGRSGGTTSTVTASSSSGVGGVSAGGNSSRNARSVSAMRSRSQLEAAARTYARRPEICSRKSVGSEPSRTRRVCFDSGFVRERRSAIASDRAVTSTTFAPPSMRTVARCAALAPDHGEGTPATAAFEAGVGRRRRRAALSVKLLTNVTSNDAFATAT